MDFSCAPAPAYGNQCPQCVRTSIILEALFNRIHVLESQVAQQSADKDAANRALYHLLDVQPTIINATRSNPSIATYVGVTSGCSEESSTSSPTQSVNRRSTKGNASSQKGELLIDLLTPLEYPAERPGDKSHSPEKTEFQSFNPHTSKDAQGYVQSVDKSRNYHHDATDLNAPYAHIRRFPKMMNESTVTEDPTTHMKASDLSSGRLTPYEELPCSSSDDTDNQENLVHSGYPSVNTSFSDHQETFTAQTDMIEEKLLKVKCNAAHSGAVKKQASRKQHYGLEHSVWAPRHEVRAFPVFISPDERRAKYCENIGVRDTDSINQKPMNQSSSDDSISTSSESHDEVTNIKHFRFLDVCGICFNPHANIEQDSYRTVMISGLPVDCTMTQVLNEVRGGMILEAKSLDTMTITGSRSVMLTFVEGSAATGLEAHAKRYGFSVSGQQVHVSLVQTPTTPMSKRIRNGITTSYHTRCLDVRNFPRIVSPQALRYDLRPMKASTFDLIENMNMNAEGVLELRFLSIDAAVNAFDVLIARDINVKYRRCRIEYGEDPCAEPWVEEDSTSEEAAMTMDSDVWANKLSAKRDVDERSKTHSMSAEDLKMDGLVIDDVEVEKGIKEVVNAEESKRIAMDEA